VKFLTLIFAFYILLLPGMPCMDTGECNEASQTEISKSQAAPQQENEDCSPFCNCACCGHILTPNFQLNKISIADPFAKQKKQSCYHSVSLSSDFFGNIWQPPRFS
jgi:hypothetical protein